MSPKKRNTKMGILSNIPNQFVKIMFKVCATLLCLNIFSVCFVIAYSDRKDSIYVSIISLIISIILTISTTIILRYQKDTL